MIMVKINLRREAAYATEREAIAKASELFCTLLFERLQAQGISVTELAETSNTHNGALMIDEGVAFLPLEIEVRFRKVLTQREYNEFIKQPDWNKKVIVKE